MSHHKVMVHVDNGLYVGPCLVVRNPRLFSLGRTYTLGSASPEVEKESALSWCVVRKDLISTAQGLIVHNSTGASCAIKASI